MSADRPVIISAGLLVPEALCAALSDALRTRPEPALRALRAAALEVAAARTTRLVSGSCPRGLSAVGVSAGAAAESMTTAEAARVLGTSARQVRRLAGRRVLAGEHDHRGIWQIDAGSVRRLAQ